MKVSRLLIISCFFLIGVDTYSQNTFFTSVHSSDEYYDFGFERDFSIQVLDEQGYSYPQPWIGGLNACQFSEIDLDLDGRLDLVVFDRHGNRILPFLNYGARGESDYTYAPEYIIRFPPVREWMNLIDFNYDGRNDLFTYTTGGIRIYENVSDTALTFRLKVPLLYSFYYNGYVNLFALTDDYPVFTDIDLDGDMDVLNFFTLGKYINYHKNLSMEKYGVCDSLDFRLTEQCWGYFEESELSNVLTLNISCGNRSDNRPLERHSGSTLLALDLDGDLDKDLLIGDVDYATIIGLLNGGTTDSAHMISQDTLFPSNSVPIHLMSMPVCNYLDVNNDGIRELVVSPFDPGLDRTDNYQSVWLYRNKGTNDAPVFELQQKDFIQEWMVDMGAGAYPVLFDVDQDGLQDLLVGNFGYLDSAYYSLGFLYLIYRSQVALFMNTGTAGKPLFTLYDRDFGGLSSLMITGAYPALYDLDNDGDADMLVGNSEGTLIFLENTAGPGQIPSFLPPVLNYQQIDAGHFSTPQLVDLDRDGDADLVIGNRNGTLSYYRNTGSADTPVFTLITEQLGGVDVTNINLSLDGYSTPCFFESDGEYRLFVGSEFGDIFYYKDIDGNLTGTFTLVDDHYLYIREGARTGMAIWNFNEDSYPDMIIGNYSGGITSFRGIIPPEVGVPEIPGQFPGIHIYPNPAHDVLYVELPATSYVSRINVQLVDILGRPVCPLQNVVSGTNEFRISGLPGGVYFMIIRDQFNTRWSYKILVY